MDRPDCTCRQDLFLRGGRAEGPDHGQEGNLHHRNGWDLRRPDADGLVQFRGAVSAVRIWFSWRDRRDLPHRRWDQRAEPREGPEHISRTSPSSRADARADLLREDTLREDTHENYFNCCSLFTGPDVYGLWVERISQLYPPAATHKSAGVTVFWRHRRIPLCRVLLRGAGVWWAVAALRPIRATCADIAGCGALQHPGVSPDDVTGHHRACAGRLRVVDSCFPAVPPKFQGHLQREGCDASINCVPVLRARCLRAECMVGDTALEWRKRPFSKRFE